MSTREPATEVRLERLERRTRRLGAALLACGLLAVATALAPRPAADDVVRARRVELVDDEGRVRAELAIDADGSAGLFVHDVDGRVRASVTHDAQQSALFLMDAEGAVRLGAAQFAHGGGGYALHGPAGRGAAVLYLKGDGSLTLYDDEGGVTARFPEGR